MTNSDLIVVFDLLEAGFKDWTFPAFGLIFVVIGFLLIRFPKRAMELFNQTNRPRFYKAFSRFFLGFSVIWIILAFAGTYGSYLLLRSAYLDGNFEVVEGPVEDFDPMPASGHARESFSVAGQKFSYSDYNVTPEFNNARSLGGPIDAGVYVRISHVGGEIVRLEVERSAVDAAEERPERSIWPTSGEFSPPEGSPADRIFRYSWVIMIVAIVANAATWRWKGRAHIARDPSLREGYNRMALGLTMWASFPVLVGGLVSMFGGASTLEVFEAPLKWFGPTAAYSLLWGVVIAKWVYWTYFQDGAAKMARHPGLINHEWVAKLWPALMAGGVVASAVFSFI